LRKIVLRISEIKRDKQRREKSRNINLKFIV